MKIATEKQINNLGINIVFNEKTNKFECKKGRKKLGNQSSTKEGLLYDLSMRFSDSL